MPSETPSNQEPVKLDLRKPDISTLQLTPEEQKSFEAFLKQKQNKEKLGVIHITREELAQLKQSIGNGTLDLFVENQAAESISTSELIPQIDGVENQKEKLNNIDEASYMYLFKGDNEIFKGQNLSEDAKRNFASAFSLYLMENLPQGASLDVKNGVKIIETLIGEKRIGNDPKLQPKLGKFFTELTAKLAVLKNVPGLTITDGGEKNALFMNPIKGLEFLKTNMTSNSAKTAIESATITEGTKIEITDIDRKKLSEISKKIGPLLKEIPGNKESDFSIQQLKENPDMLESLQKLTETKPFGAFFKFVLSLLGIGDINEAIEGAYYGNIKKSFGKMIGEKNLIISSGNLGSDFMMNGANKDMTFVSNLRKLHQKGKPDETFLNTLLKNGGELSNMIVALNVGPLLNSGNVDYKVLSEGVNHLVGYKEWVKVKGNEGKNMQDYVVSLKEEKQTNTENTGGGKAPEKSTGTKAKAGPTKTSNGGETPPTTEISDDAKIKGNSLKLLKGEIIDGLSDIFRNGDYSDFKRIKIKDIQTTENIDILLKNAIGGGTYIDGKEIEKSDYEELSQEVKDSLKNAIKTIKEYPNLKSTFISKDWGERDLTIWKLIEDKDFKEYITKK